MNCGARGADLLLQLGSGYARQHLPAPRAYFAGRGGRTQARDRFGEAERFERLLGVGGEQQAGADLQEFGRTLED